MRSPKPKAHVFPEGGWCRHCGHRGLTTTACASGPNRLWFAYCPQCGRVHQHASIPESFGDGLLAAGVPPGPLH